MIFIEKEYRVLLVSSAERFNNATLAILSAGGYNTTVVSNASEARRTLADMPFDIVIINSPLADDPGIKLSTDTCLKTDAAVLLFVRADSFELVSSKVMDFGVITLSKPTSSQIVDQTLRMLCSVRERIRRENDKRASVEDKLEEMRLVNRAKWLLIEDGMTEEEAHKYIEKKAMDERRSKKDIADAIIKKANKKGA